MQNAARLQYAAQQFGTPEALAALKQSRGAQAAMDYESALQQIPNIGPEDAAQFNQLLDRPAFVKAWTQAEQVAADHGVPPEQMNLENVSFLNRIKWQLDQQANWGVDLKNPPPNMVQAEKDAISGARATVGAFKNVVDNVAPLYPVARANYAAATRQINQMQTLIGEGGVVDKATQGAPFLGTTPSMEPGRMRSALLRLGESGRADLTPEQNTALDNLMADLNQSAAWYGPGVRGPGSATVRWGLSTNQLANSLNVLPEALVPKALTGKLDFTPKVTEVMARAMTSDPEMGLALLRDAAMRRLLPQRSLADLFGPIGVGIGAGAAGTGVGNANVGANSQSLADLIPQ
jgi:hypothetical protein